MKKKKAVIIIRIILAVLAVGFLLLGIIRKEPSEVRGKGSLICLECAGFE